jgi:hypothetical protein
MRLTVVVLLLFAVCATASSQPGPLREPGNQSPDHQQIRGNDALDAIASQLSAIREQTARIEKERTDREANPFWPPSPSNWILILLTGGAVVAAFITLDKLERQTKAAEDAANAAKSSAETADLTLKTTQRAFIVFEIFNTTAAVSRSPLVATTLVGFDVTPRFKNTGHLPALKLVSASAVLRTTEHPAADANIFPATAPEVFAGQGSGVSAPVIRLSPTDIDYVLAGGVMFVHAHVKYRDGFADTPLRNTSVCAKLTFKGDPRLQANGQDAAYCFHWSGGPDGHSYVD